LYFNRLNVLIEAEMKIVEVYEKFRIMPQLQMHMLRVAGVSTIICDNLKIKVGRQNIIQACLLHDMGNMAKIKLDLFPEFAQPKGLTYWQKVLQEFIEKYGADDYVATYKILDELNISDKIQALIKSIEFANMDDISKGNNFGQKICIYSDARVAPFGVTPLEDRLSEVKDRYIKNKGATEEFFKNLSNSARNVEKQIFSHCKIKPVDITEEKAKTLFSTLKNFDISANV